MSDRYTSQTATGYNATPPPDDGSAVSGNVVEWQKHLDKIGDPIKNLVDSINTALVNHFTRSEAAKTSSYVAATSDFNKVIEMNVSSGTFTLPPLASAEMGWHVTVKNINATECTIDGNASETIDGLTSFTIGENKSVTLMANQAENDWMIIEASGEFPKGTAMGFYQASEPGGWTQTTGFATDSTILVSNTSGGNASNNNWAITGLNAAVSGNLPNHTHPRGNFSVTVAGQGIDVNNGATQVGADGNYVVSGNSGNPNSNPTINANGAVTHNVANWRPPALTFIVCTKD